MKFFLLLFFTAASFIVQAQASPVGQLPAGTYQIQNPGSSAFKGNIVLVDGSHYKLSNETTTGEYKFSATAQRILFLSGTLKGAFARTVTSGSDTVIVLPRKENEDVGFKLIRADLQAFYKKN